MPPSAGTSSWTSRLATLLGRRNRAAPVSVRAWRRLFHVVAGASLAAFVFYGPQNLLLPSLVALAAVAVTLELARQRLTALNRLLVRWLAPLLKGDEDRRITGSTYMLAGALGALLLFDRTPAAVALLFLALGDPVAALVGRPAPGPRLWGKSPVGALAFMAAGMSGVGAWVLLWGLPWHWGLVAGAAAAALVELLPLPVDDNLSIPLAAGAVLRLAGAG